MSTPKKAFHEIWQLKLNEPETSRSLWLRFSVLVSKNGFKQMAEVWGVLSQRGSQKEIKRVVMKQSFDLTGFRFEPPCSLQVGELRFDLNGSVGSIQSKGQSMSWNLSWQPQEDLTFQTTPPILKKLNLIRLERSTLQENLRVSGILLVQDEKIEFSQARGALTQISEPSHASTEIWSHCNQFTNDQGESADLIFEGFSAHQKQGLIPLPQISSFYLRYQKKDYRFNQLKNSFLNKSTCDLNGWKFQVDEGDLSFRGEIQTELRDFTGVTYETINGSLIYGSNSNLSQMKILVYRRGKLESTFLSSGTTTFEMSSPQKNPYIPSHL